MESTKDPLVWINEGSSVGELQQELSRCSPEQNYWNSVEDSDDIRFCRWAGQDSDGLKHSGEDADAFPWDGASDTRVHFADAIINENVAVCCNAFWASVARASGRESSDMEAAGGASKVIDHFMDRIKRRLMSEVELSAQYMQHYGWVVLHPTWKREVQMENRHIRFDELMQLAVAVGRQDPQHPLARLPEVIADPEQEAEAMELLGMLHGQYVAQNLKGIDEGEWPKIRNGTLRKVLKQLNTDGVAELPMPYLCRNEPMISALRPYDEVFLSNTVTDIEQSRVFVRYWMTEAELRAMETNDGWDADWIEEAVKLKGHQTRWKSSDANITRVDELDVIERPEHELIEVFYAYEKRLNEDGIPMILCTIFHAMIDKNPKSTGMDLVAKHGPLDYQHGRMPFTAGTRERWCRSIPAARGVPQIVATWQFEMKAQRDGLVDRTSMTTLPSVLVSGRDSGGMQYKFGPGTQVAYRNGMKPEFMDLPKYDGTAMQVMDMIQWEADNYFGRLSDRVPAPRIQAKQQMMVNQFLSAWQDALTQMLQLSLQYLEPEEWERISGSPKPQMGPGEIARLYDLDLTFDARGLDVDFTMKQLDAISKLVIPEDVTGAIDRAKLTKMKLMAIDPSLAKQLVVDQSSASQKMFDQVRNDLAQMFLGNEAQYVEGDPTAEAKLQFATQIIQSNPNYQQALQAQGRFGELVQKYAKNLEFSMQQRENAKVGRIGVQRGEG